MDLKWMAVYEDNTVLPQLKDDGTENKYTDIDRERLTEFIIYNDEDDAKRKILVLSIDRDEGERLIYRRRNSMDATTGDTTWSVLLVGWQKLVNGKNVQNLNWIFPDGTIVNTGRFHNESRVLYETDFYDWEKKLGLSQSEENLRERN